MSPRSGPWSGRRAAGPWSPDPYAVIAFGGGAVLDPITRGLARRAGAGDLVAGPGPGTGSARVGLHAPLGRHGPTAPHRRAVARGGPRRDRPPAGGCLPGIGPRPRRHLRSLPEPGRHRCSGRHRLDVRAMRTIAVDLGSRSYEIVVGAGALGRAAAAMAGRARVAVVSQEAIADQYADAVLDALRSAGTTAEVFLIGDGEEAKSLADGGVPLPPLRRLGPPPGRRRRGPRRRGRRRHGRLHRCRLPPGRGLPPGADDAAGPGRRRHRRQDRGQPARKGRTSSAPSTSPSPC